MVVSARLRHSRYYDNPVPRHNKYMAMDCESGNRNFSVHVGNTHVDGIHHGRKRPTVENGFENADVGQCDCRFDVTALHRHFCCVSSQSATGRPCAVLRCSFHCRCLVPVVRVQDKSERQRAVSR